jgi:hypothetical protein
MTDTTSTMDGDTLYSIRETLREAIERLHHLELHGCLHPDYEHEREGERRERPFQFIASMTRAEREAFFARSLLQLRATIFDIREEMGGIANKLIELRDETLPGVQAVDLDAAEAEAAWAKDREAAAEAAGKAGPDGFVPGSH